MERAFCLKVADREAPGKVPGPEVEVIARQGEVTPRTNPQSAVRSYKMPITGAPENIIAVGGLTSQGPAKGIYKAIVNESVLGKPSNKTGRIPLVLDLFVKGDSNHPEKEGKRLEKYRQWLPMASDDKEKKALMNGMLKRQIFDAFEIPWLKDEKSNFDARILTGKTAYVLIGDVKQEDGSFRNGVTHMAPTLEKLPQPKTTDAEPANVKRRR